MAEHGTSGGPRLLCAQLVAAAPLQGLLAPAAGLQSCLSHRTRPAVLAYTACLCILVDTRRLPRWLAPAAIRAQEAAEAAAAEELELALPPLGHKPSVDDPAPALLRAPTERGPGGGANGSVGSDTEDDETMPSVVLRVRGLLRAEGTALRRALPAGHACMFVFAARSCRAVECC